MKMDYCLISERMELFLHLHLFQLLSVQWLHFLALFSPHLVANRATANSIAVRIWERRMLQTRGVKEDFVLKLKLRFQSTWKRWGGEERILRCVKVDGVVMTKLFRLQWQIQLGSHGWCGWGVAGPQCSDSLWLRSWAATTGLLVPGLGKSIWPRSTQGNPRGKSGSCPGREERMMAGLD